MQLHPRESFTIVRQIEDHTDTSTYYVRAVVRNAKSDVLLATVDLTDRGSQRFSKDWLVPADVSGQGFWLSILTSVYTDAGYTTKSQNYGDKLETYLVQERAGFNPNYPIPVGPDIDYKKIKKIIDEAIEKRAEVKQEVKTIEPQIKIVEVVKEIPIISPPPTVKVAAPNLKPIIEAIKNIDFPMVEKPDFSAIIAKLDELNKKPNVNYQRDFDQINTLLNKLIEIVKPKPVPVPVEYKLTRTDRLLGKTIISEKTKKLLK